MEGSQRARVTVKKVRAKAARMNVRSTRYGREGGVTACVVDWIENWLVPLYYGRNQGERIMLKFRE